jgi:phosphoribosylaminoimidazolecarboxamide formyltransferase/IMP cyclohydrolase
MERLPVTTALLSVSDRTGLVDLARGLTEAGVTLIATDSTAAHLADAGIASTAVATITGFPEMLDGRVKTLHPKIYGGILADRSKPEHLAALDAQGIPRIDLVVVNLYPFRETVASDAAPQQIVEKIDVGGPAMVRAAAKNHAGVAIVVDPARYPVVLNAVQQGGTTLELRAKLAAEAFAHTAAYDAAVSAWMHRDVEFPPRVTIALERVGEPLRYGENPHQRGALYREQDASTATLANATQVQGPERSFNNYVDLEAAWNAAIDFEEPSCAIIKHATPCGLATARDVATAYTNALECDRLSAFGGIVAFNRPMTLEAAELLAKVRTDCLIAPGYEAGVLERLAGKKNMRVMLIEGTPRPEAAYRRIGGGFLVQGPDVVSESRSTMRVASETQPSEEMWSDLLFAWRACKHVRSNGIVLASDGMTVGIGGGQVSRVDAVEIAARKAGDRAKGSVMASDAFLPFRDGLDAGAAAGVSAVIQPGGSVKDDEVIAAADEHGIPMVLTGIRHFRHG